MKQLLAALIGLPLSFMFGIILWLALVACYAGAYVFGWNEAVIPFAETLNITLPSISFVWWMILLCAAGIFRSPFSRISDREVTKESVKRVVGKAIGTWLIVAALVILKHFFL